MVYLPALKSKYSYTSYVQETKHYSDPLSLIPQFAIETGTTDLILDI